MAHVRLGKAGRSTVYAPGDQGLTQAQSPLEFIENDGGEFIIREGDHFGVIYPKKHFEQGTAFRGPREHCVRCPDYRVDSAVLPGGDHQAVDPGGIPGRVRAVKSQGDGADMGMADAGHGGCGFRRDAVHPGSGTVGRNGEDKRVGPEAPAGAYHLKTSGRRADVLNFRGEPKIGIRRVQPVHQGFHQFFGAGLEGDVPGRKGLPGLLKDALPAPSEPPPGKSPGYQAAEFPLHFPQNRKGAQDALPVGVGAVDAGQYRSDHPLEGLPAHPPGEEIGQ